MKDDELNFMVPFCWCGGVMLGLELAGLLCLAAGVWLCGWVENGRKDDLILLGFPCGRD